MNVQIRTIPSLFPDTNLFPFCLLGNVEKHKVGQPTSRMPYTGNDILELLLFALDTSQIVILVSPPTASNVMFSSLYSNILDKMTCGSCARPRCPGCNEAKACFLDASSQRIKDSFCGNCRCVNASF